jgi:hypothetical protein
VPRPRDVKDDVQTARDERVSRITTHARVHVRLTQTCVPVHEVNAIVYVVFGYRNNIGNNLMYLNRAIARAEYADK